MSIHILCALFLIGLYVFAVVVEFGDFFVYILDINPPDSGDLQMFSSILQVAFLLDSVL